MKPPRYWIALAATAFLAPILGGQIVLDPQALAPDGLVTAVFREPQGASLAHLLVAVPALVALVVALFRRHVQQLPKSLIAGFLAVFMLFAWGSVAMSAYPSISLASAFEWTAMVLVFFTVVGLAGRQRGPTAIIGAFVAGVAVVAALGIREYAMQTDANWRIFGNWANPNALAGVLPFGVLGGLGLLAVSEDRLAKMGAGLAVVLSSIAMFMTGSKGGFVALIAGLVVLLVWWLVHAGEHRGKLLALGVILPVLGVGLAIGLTSAQRAKMATGGSALGRIAQGGNTQEQSAGFRTLLWRSAAELIKDQPIGRGLGTFRFHSARPGIITQTHLAHQSFLQLGAEVGIFSLAAFLAAIFAMAVEGLRGVRKLPVEVRTLRGAVYAALGAAVVHNLIDSDLYVFGTGVGFFIFAGVLLQLTPDGSNPEFAQKPLRWATAAFAMITLFGMAFAAVTDVRLGNLRYLAGERDPKAAEAFDALAGWAPGDYRVWALGARLSADAKVRRERLERSLQTGPTMMVYRQLATEKSESGDVVGAQRALNESLRLDPNNLQSLRGLMRIHEPVDADKTDEIAHRLVEIESKPYFKIRALPELVPTETFEARAWLASRKSTVAEQSDLLRGAIEGYLNYAGRTVPMIVMFAKAGLDGGYGGVSRDDALASIVAAIDLLGAYQASDPSQASWIDASRTTLEEARDSLSEITP